MRLFHHRFVTIIFYSLSYKLQINRSVESNSNQLMKFVALISGGKDSFFNIHHCLSRGHDLIALANLYPSQKDQHEIDSFMFQTVGHDVIEYYSECMAVPLYRQPINGSSSNQDLEYSQTDDDEIEDLFKLLKDVKENHPDVEGVSCGAILSHYQRTRVENVCGRLGLTCLAFLWQRDQLQLMQEMCTSGLDARIIKVAAIGLTRSHLGKSIQQLFPHLLKLNSMYEVHICGEGGEFETIVLDAIFFKKRIIITNQEIVEDESNDVAYLKLLVELQDKELQEFVPLDEPNIFQEEFYEIHDDLSNSKITGAAYQDPDGQDSDGQDSTRLSINLKIKSHVVSTNSKLYISNLVSSATTLEQQITEIFDNLRHILESHQLKFNDIQHIQLLVSEMSNFGHINEIYSKYFDNIYLPPSRVCVQTKLNNNNLLMISCVALKNNTLKRGIHIRSISYWAPHNIGPYSQCRVEERASYKVATISGQIPLLPSSMAFTQKGISFESTLALLHLFKIKSLVNVKNLVSVTCFITNTKLIPIILKTWELYTEIVEGQSCLPKINIVEVEILPRSASVEWAGISFENINGMYDDDDNDNSSNNIYKKISEKRIPSSLIKNFESVSITEVGNCALIFVILFTNNVDYIKELEIILSKDDHLQIFTTSDWINIINSQESKIEFIPVKSNYNYKGEKFNFAVLWKIEC